MSATRSNGFTGWHMLAIMIAFFGTIVSVNIFMAYLANTSWSGMLAKNTYVASQDFNKNAARAREWAGAGFSGDISLEGGRIGYRLLGPAEIVSGVSHVEARFHRPVGDKQDFSVRLIREGGLFVAPGTPPAGPWIVDLASWKDGEVVFHQAERIVSGER